MMAKYGKLNVTSDAELLSFIINSTPELQGEIDLPVQGESIKPIGEIIINNERYKNAFLNTINLIGLTIIKRNGWDNPWDFTNRGTLRWGQQIRELINDLCNVYDYNENFDNKTRFLETEVPNLYNYIHEVNFQKFYQTTTSDNQMRMAFEGEGSLFDYIEDAISMLYESWTYDKYITDKYMLCRRLIDGTVTPTYIENFVNLTARQRVSAIKSVSNKMTFRNPNYNPAGVRRATKFDDQILIVSTDFEAEFSTEVLATSFFKNEADMKARLVLCDGFGVHDTERLSELLGDAYVEFNSDEIELLSSVPAVLISREWFMDYMYALDGAGDVKATEFYNPTTMENNHFLHVWAVFSTSPFEQASVFGLSEPNVTDVTVNPSEATVTAGQSIQLSATVTATGFANKAVQWYVKTDDSETGASVNAATGVVRIPADATAGAEVTIAAKSIFNSEVEGTATVTVA